MVTGHLDRQQGREEGAPQPRRHRRDLQLLPRNRRDPAGRLLPDLREAGDPDRQHDGTALVSPLGRSPVGEGPTDPTWIARGRVVAAPAAPRHGDHQRHAGQLLRRRAGLRPDDAARTGRALVDEGADLLDIGGESSRPGAEPVPLDEEIAPGRSPPSRRWPRRVSVPISVDTTKPEVARWALEAGAAILNDITAPGRPGDGRRRRRLRRRGRPDAHAGDAADDAGRPATMRTSSARSVTTWPAGRGRRSPGDRPRPDRDRPRDRLRQDVRAQPRIAPEPRGVRRRSAARC